MLTVGRSKNKFRTGRVIPLNPVAFAALVKWAGRSADVQPTHYVFPWRKSHVSRRMLEHYSGIRLDAKRKGPGRHRHNA